MVSQEFLDKWIGQREIVPVDLMICLPGFLVGHWMFFVTSEPQNLEEIHAIQRDAFENVCCKFDERWYAWIMTGNISCFVPKIKLNLKTHF